MVTKNNWETPEAKSIIILKLITILSFTSGHAGQIVVFTSMKIKEVTYFIHPIVGFLYQFIFFIPILAGYGLYNNYYNKKIKIFFKEYFLPFFVFCILLNLMIFRTKNPFQWHVLYSLLLSSVIILGSYKILKKKYLFILFFILLLHPIYLSYPVFSSFIPNFITGLENNKNTLWPLLPTLSLFLSGFLIAMDKKRLLNNKNIFKTNLTSLFLVAVCFFFFKSYVFGLQINHIFKYVLNNPETEVLISSIFIFLFFLTLGIIIFKKIDFKITEKLKILGSGSLVILIFQYFLLVNSISIYKNSEIIKPLLEINPFVLRIIIIEILLLLSSYLVAYLWYLITSKKITIRLRKVK